ncbi:MAG: hypothetical protein DYH03_16350 [Nitrospira sp. NTP1]|nr:hypothetical protein [Nitrospira sp.]MCE7978661.1 hypothetical protein [Nitrospira sp. NTP1]
MMSPRFASQSSTEHSVVDAADSHAIDQAWTTEGANTWHSITVYVLALLTIRSQRLIITCSPSRGLEGPDE